MTIVPGSGGAKGQQVASCTDAGGFGDTFTLYCQVTVTAATSSSASGTTTGSAGALSLQAHYTSTDGTKQHDGPVVHSGCSTVIGYDGKPNPKEGQCCFVFAMATAETPGSLPTAYQGRVTPAPSPVVPYVQGKRKKGAVDKVRSQANERRDFVSALASDDAVISPQHTVAGGHAAAHPSTSSSSSSSSSSSNSHLNTFVMADVKPDVEPNAVEAVEKSSSEAATPSEQAAFEASVVADKTA